MRAPEVVCLCGSTRFKGAYERAAKEMALAGIIHLTVGPFSHGDDPLTDEQKAALDELHLRKIDLAGRIHVLNVNCYIGDSTRAEIAYAEEHGKTVTYLEGNLLDGQSWTGK